MGLCQQYAAIWPVEEQDTSQAVCMAESHGNPNAECHNCVPGVAEDSRCLWQVNVLAHPQYASWDLSDPGTCARAALEVWQAQGWRAWSTFTAGIYEQFLTGGPVGAVQASADDLVASVTSDGSNIVPWLVGGAVAILLLLGRR